MEIVAHFSYLGIVFSKTGSFNIAKKELVNKGIKAMYEVLRKGRIHNLSIKCQLDLFDKIIKPIVFYCMGVKFGGLQAKNDIIDRVHLKFCKLLLGTSKSIHT